MTTEAQPSSANRSRAGSATARLAPALAAIAGIWVVSLALWWLLVDPKWGIFDGAYPQPAGAYLFWVIGIYIIAAFNFGGWPFAGLSQPLAGVLSVITHVVLGCGVVLFIVYVLGRWDAVFSSSAPGESGFLACALIVLPGFYCWTAVTAHLGNWPYADLTQPRQGLGAFLIGAFMTMAGFFILIHPELAEGASASPFRLGTAVGWLYSVIVIALMFPMVWQNWPWSAMRHPAGSLLSIPLCFGLGTGLYFVLHEVVQGLTPAAVEANAAFNLNFEVANLGVCFSVWALSWGLIIRRQPAAGGLAWAIVGTIVVTVLAVLTYIVYTRWFATQVLHEPAYDGNYGGFALLWMNWVALVLLWYAVSFGALGLRTRNVD